MLRTIRTLIGASIPAKFPQHAALELGAVVTMGAMQSQLLWLSAIDPRMLLLASPASSAVSLLPAARGTRTVSVMALRYE